MNNTYLLGEPIVLDLTDTLPEWLMTRPGRRPAAVPGLEELLRPSAARRAVGGDNEGPEEEEELDEEDEDEFEDDDFEDDEDDFEDDEDEDELDEFEDQEDEDEDWDEDED